MAARIRTVCLLHSHLAPAFRALGVGVVALDPPAGVISLPELLADVSPAPDCVIQQEHLAKRLVLTDLDAAPCPTVFWARDPHLNFFWQRHYARLFSAVAATQPQMPEAFRACGVPRAAWVTWHGQARPFVPHARRAVPLAFAGRITPERPRRQWFVDHMARFGLTWRDDVFGVELAAFYDAARVVPNETIAGEINQRLFEAASSGCLAVSERTPPAVEELLRPGDEALYFDDVLELDDHLRFATAHPERVEAMGRAAWQAVNARHLPEHRARALLDLAEEAVSAGATGGQAAAATALTLVALAGAGQLALSPEAVWQRLWAAPATPEVMAARVRLAFAAGRADVVRELAAVCAADPALAGRVEPAAACCLAGWRLGDPEMARRAHMAWLGGQGRPRARHCADLRDALLFFAGAFAEAGLLASPGQPFDPDRELPGDAAQCLMAIVGVRPDDILAVRRLEALLERLPGRQVEQVGCLSTLTLHRRDDWALGLELGRVDLRAFRREAGLDEVALAAATACRLGQDERFARRLAGVDPSGRLRRALAAAAAASSVERARRPAR